MKDHRSELPLHLLKGGYAGNLSAPVDLPPSAEEREQLAHRRFRDFIGEYKEFGLSVTQARDEVCRRVVFTVEWDGYEKRHQRKLFVYDIDVKRDCRTPADAIDFFLAKVADVVFAELGNAPNDVHGRTEATASRTS